MKVPGYLKSFNISAVNTLLQKYYVSSGNKCGYVKSESDLKRVFREIGKKENIQLSEKITASEINKNFEKIYSKV